MPTPDEILSAHAEHGSNRAAAQALGMDERGYRRSRQRALRGEVGGPPIPEIGRPAEGFAVFKNSAEYDDAGNLRKQWVGTKRDAGEVFEALPGHVVKGESALVDADGRVMQRWVKTTAGQGGATLVDGLRAAFAAHDGASKLIPAPAATNDEILTVYPLADLHVGLYSWGAECGDDYDVEIATDLVKRNISSLVSKSEPSKRAVILGLGDLFHQNDQKNSTPGSGHRLDVDGRWSRVFEAGAKLIVSLIDMALQKHEIIDLVLLPGNHDEDASICLRIALALFYSNNPRVRVYNKPGLHWAMRFGKNLIGATHGHTMGATRMAMMLAADYAKDWGETTYRVMYFGHIHHDKVKTIGAVKTESFTTPAAKDAFAAGGGWRNQRTMCAITLRIEGGEKCRHIENIPDDWASVRAAA